MSAALKRERAPLPDWVLKRHPNPCRPRKRHECRICGQWIYPGEECVRWTGVERGEGWWTAHVHPECYVITRPGVQLYWPKVGKEVPRELAT